MECFKVDCLKKWSGLPNITKNAKFFHFATNLNRRNNTVEYLDVNESFSNITEIRKHILQFYNCLYFEQFSWRPNLDGFPFDLIDDEEAIWLDEDKALSPDGFSLAFFQTC